MNTIWNAIAVFGASILAMAIVGQFPGQDFRLYFGPDAAAAGCAMEKNS